MPHRVTGVPAAVLGVLGLFLVTGLLLLRADLRRAARTGPKWKRALVAAAMTLLASLGLGACAEDAQTPAGGPPAATRAAAEADRPPAAATRAATAPAVEALARSPHWQRVAGIWDRAEEIASGRRGRYPLTNAGKRRLLASAAEFETNLTALTRTGLLAGPEAQLLRLEYGLFADQIRLTPSQEKRPGCCSEEYTREAIREWRRFAPAFGQVAAAGKLHPEARDVILDAIDARIEALNVPPVEISARMHTQARRHLSQALALAKKIEGLPTTGARVLGKSAEWKTILKGLGVYTGGGFFRDGSPPSASDARAAVAALRRRGLLHAAEATLLTLELDRVRRQRKRDSALWGSSGLFGEGGRTDADKPPFSRTESGKLGDAYLRLLRPLADGGKIHPPMLEIVGRASRRAEECFHSQLFDSKAHADAWAAMQREIAAVVAKIKTAERLDSSGLLAAEAWRQFKKTRDRAEAALRKGPDLGRTEINRTLLELRAARASLKRLGRAGLLTPPEVALLEKERLTLLEAATDLSEYWGLDYLPSLAYGAKGLAVRTALLAKIAALPHPHWELLRRTLPAIETDVAVAQGADAAIAEVLARFPVDSDDLAKTRRWRYVTAVWRLAEATASFRKGYYPYNGLGKHRLAGMLHLARRDVETLQRAGLLTPAEGSLLTGQLELFRDTLGWGVQPSENHGVMCYAGGPQIYLGNTWQGLRHRLPLLEKLAAAGQVKPEVIFKLLYTLEQDLDGDLPRVDNDEENRKAGFPTYAEAVKIEAEARGLLRRLLDRMSAPDAALERSPHWQVIGRAWRPAREAALRGGTEAQRREVDRRLDDAVAAARRLWTLGMLTRQERQLIYGEAGWLRRYIFSRPAADDEGIVYEDPHMYFCEAAWLDIARTVAAAAAERAKHAAGMRPAVLKLAIASIQTEVDLLADAGFVGRVSRDDRKSIEALRRDGLEEVAKLKALVAEKETAGPGRASPRGPGAGR